ncbi:MAG: SUF system NifU family Fe-S cluster assembly protein [Chloroflexota bacterium]|nr:SUF system NifU family Fe-S cluster assembly protein [Chloroflexota bacterium]PLS78316.1 MAG: SUF system NifU family Fe-S cluster assembly protein [Chloroflexota bacterium]
MDDFYQQNILDHSRHPRNSGRLDHPSVSREEMNPLCGDKLQIDLQIEDGVVTAVGFTGRGCAISQAAASMLTEEIKGKSVAEVRALSKDDVLGLLGIPIGYTRLKCALLGLKAIKVGVYNLADEEFDDDELF